MLNYLFEDLFSKAYIFLIYFRMMLDNGGIFVCKCRHLQLAGGGKASSGGGSTPGVGGMPGFMSPRKG